MSGKRTSRTRFACRDCGFEGALPRHHQQQACPACGWIEGTPAMVDSVPDFPREEVARTQAVYERLAERLSELRCGQPPLVERVGGLVESRRGGPGVMGSSQAEVEALRQAVKELEGDLSSEQQRRGHADRNLKEAIARLEDYRARTDASLRSLQEENAELTTRISEASAQGEQLQSEAKRIQSQAEAALPLGRHVDWLEEENLALRRKLENAERTLRTAAKIAGRVASLQDEIDRLGTQYLQAQEEAREARAVRDQVEDELSQVVDRFLAAAPHPPAASAQELSEARDLIRKVSSRLNPPPPASD